MAVIVLNTNIEAPIDRVFDLARSIDAHMASACQTSEVAVAGRTSGLIELNETVTWEARHFGIKQRLTVQITTFDHPFVFEDKMLKGAFKSMFHRHEFRENKNGTTMIDHFEFSAPLGALGQFAEILFLKSYMKAFLFKRSLDLKKIAESDDWKHFLDA